MSVSYRFYADEPPENNITFIFTNGSNVSIPESSSKVQVYGILTAIIIFSVFFGSFLAWILTKCIQKIPWYKMSKEFNGGEYK